jgi:leucyl aminopeptidase
MINIKYQLATDDKTKTLLIPFLKSEAINYKHVHLKNHLFAGKEKTSYATVVDDVHYFFIGLGEKPTYKDIQTAFRRFAHQNKKLHTKSLLVDLTSFDEGQVEAAIIGLVLGTYQLGHFKADQKPHIFLNGDFEILITSANASQQLIDQAIKIAEAQLACFNYVDLPSNVVTPTYLAEKAIGLQGYNMLTTKIIDQADAEKIGLHSFLAVGKGSATPAKFIIVEYRHPEAKKHFGLIGKAITFDTGGYNIKTQGMVHMKCDMAGGATVLAAIQLIADLQMKANVTAIIPACENRIDNQACVPSDVINSYSGKTIEIIDTDAEGRLVLADGISYMVKHYQTDVMIDVATLTGSAAATFGDVCAAMFTNNVDLAKQTKAIGMNIDEKSWPLPLWDDYKNHMDSDIADIKNFSGKPMAGAISAAKFLEFFTENHPAWMHLDIAGVSFIDDEFAKTKHASAWGVHLLAKLVEDF